MYMLCPAYYAAKELAKKIITTILKSDGAEYVRKYMCIYMFI